MDVLNEYYEDNHAYMYFWQGLNELDQEFLHFLKHKEMGRKHWIKE